MQTIETNNSKICHALGSSEMLLKNCLMDTLLYKSVYIPAIWFLLFEKKDKEEAGCL